MPLPSPPAVNLISVTLAAFGLRNFTFDTPFSSPPAGLDPVFEVSVDGITWSGPANFVGNTPTSVAYTYPLPFWPAVFFRILGQPSTMNWLPSILNVPVSGPIPFP